jgi:hypothetical protein
MEEFFRKRGNKVPNRISGQLAGMGNWCIPLTGTDLNDTPRRSDLLLAQLR